MQTVPRNGVLTLLLGLCAACQAGSHDLSDAQRGAVADTARMIVQDVFNKSNRLDFMAALTSYSPDADARYIENGVLIPSFDALKKEYAELGPTLDSLANTVDSLNVLVLATDAAAVTAPVHFRIKAKGRPAYTGQYVWSGIVQRRRGAWKIVQSHESWVNAQDVMAALAPPSTKAPRSN